MTESVEPVAIVGTAALLPGATSVAQFWRNLVEGRDLMTDVPRTRWLVEEYYDPEPRAVDKTYGRRGAFLPEVDFDPLRFGIPPNNLSAIDTSQLLALVVAEQVLADCTGRPVDPERTSVLIGASPLERMVEAGARLQRPVWLRALREHGIAEDTARAICDRIAASYVPWQEETFPGLLTNVISGRIASRFNLHGINHTTDAACASSLAALYTGLAELSLGRSDMVIVGGVDTMNDVTMFTCFAQTPALSPTGDCRPFSADADGTMLGEGLVLFALKRLVDAERDDDRIYAVVRGAGASSDGRGAAIYAPVAAGQARALRRAYEAAGYGPETVELVEAHGTGTNAGDAAEFTALREVFDETGRPERQWCALGSVKSQIGHTKSTAGAAGLLKAVLALHHKVLLPTIKVDRPHPDLELERSPFHLNTEARPWIRPADGHPRRASVSSFGFGGTNFHVTVEEYPYHRPSRLPAAPTELVLLSASSVAALRARVGRLDLDRDLPELARRTQAEFEPAADVRLAVVATSTDDLSTKLAEALSCVEDGRRLGPHLMAHAATGPTPAGKLGFLFPGQGAQYVGMGADLAVHLGRARAAWDRAAALDLGGDTPLHRVVFPPPAFTDADRADQQARLTATEWAQPALAVQSLALLEVLDAAGVRPDCVAGHSFGELVALHAAGAYDADTLVRLARRRGELMAAAPAGGAMLAVAADRATVEAAIAGAPDVWLANHNGPRQVVLAGAGPALDAVAGRLAEAGIATTPLNAATAFHSPFVAPATRPLLDHLRDLEVCAPRRPVFGNAGGLEYPADAAAVRERLAAQLAEPVAFLDVIEAMYATGVRTFVEVGAGSALTGLVGQILGDRPHLAVALDRRGRHGLTSLQEGLGRLAVHGVAVDPAPLTADVAAAPQRASLSKSVVRLDGGNYGRPYPPLEGSPPIPPISTPALPPVPMPAPASLPALPPAPVPAPVSPPAPVPGPQRRPESTVDNGWLGVIEDVQRRTAEAHSAFQQTLTEAHLAYLRMAETTLAGLLGTGAPAAVPPIPPLAVPPTPPPASPPAAPPPTPPAAASLPATPPPTAPAPSPADIAPSLAPEVGIEAYLLSVVAERTGYPAEILDLDMTLEADLGIDSIKRVEILAAVRDRVGELSTEELSALARLRTLRDLADRLGGGTAPAGEESAAAEPGGELTRRTLVAVPAPASGLRLPGLGDGPIAVTDDGRGIAPLVVTGLRRHGIQAALAQSALDTPQASERAGVIVLDGLRPVATVEDATDAQRRAFAAARSVAARMTTNGGVFVVVQDTGGDFGLTTGATPDSVNGHRAWLGGLVALARTAAKEWPAAIVKAIDCAAIALPIEAVAEAIVAELVGGAGAAEVGLRADGTRVVPQLIDAPVLRRPGVSPIGPESVIVATGGARGVTAAALRQLAAEYRPRLVLIGQTPLAADDDGLRAATDEPALIRLLAAREPAPPVDVAARAGRVLAAREIKENLAAFERSGVTVRYVTADARDAGALVAALDEVRREWGPITGIVHGAGVLADARLEDKTDAQFDRVVGTKVDGLRALLAATADDPLTVLCAFSSVAAVFGNPGQSDYAMANEVLTRVLADEQRRRPGCLVRSIAWGPWQGGMVTATVAERFRANGVPLIDPDWGARAFVNDLSVLDPSGRDPVLTILTPPEDRPPDGVELRAEVEVSQESYPYLADHRLDGAAVVPVATVLDWFAGVAAAWRPQWSGFSLRDLRVLHRIAVPEEPSEFVRLFLRGHPSTGMDGPSLELDLRDRAGRPRVRATVVEAGAPGDWPAPSDVESLAHPYDGTALFHGPALRVIRGMPDCGPSGATGVLGDGGGGGRSVASRFVDVAAVDGALQLALLWARRVGAGATLPMAVGEVRVHRRGPVDDTARGVVRAVRADQTDAVCDAAVLDLDGRPRIELLGIQLVRRPGS